MFAKLSFSRYLPGAFLAMLILLTALFLPQAGLAQADNPAHPAQPVKLIFIHHSTGENWLTDGYGDLGRSLAENNYFVSDTNYSRPCASSLAAPLALIGFIAWQRRHKHDDKRRNR